MDKNLILLVIVLLCVASSTIITTDKIRDKRKKWLKSLTPKGWILISLNIVILIITLFQYWENKNEIKEREKAQKLKDSINYQKLEKNNKKNLSIIASMLGKYSLLTISPEKGIVLKKETLIECDNFFRYKYTNCYEYAFDLSLICQDIGCYGAYVNVDVIVKDTLNNLYFLRKLPILINKRVSENLPYVKTIRFSFVSKIKVLYLYTTGEYKDLITNKKYELDKLFAYYIKNGTTFEASKDILYELRKSNLNRRYLKNNRIE